MNDWSSVCVIASVGKGMHHDCSSCQEPGYSCVMPGYIHGLPIRVVAHLHA